MSTIRSTYRLFNSTGNKVATAVSYNGEIFQVAPEKKSFPDLEAWKAAHPSNTSITENQKKQKAPVVYKPFAKATTPSLRHLMQYSFLYPSKKLFFVHPIMQDLVQIHYKPWFEKAFIYIRKPDNSLEVQEFTSFTELGLRTKTPDLWVEQYEGIRVSKLAKYEPVPGQKEAFVLVAGRNTAVLAAQELQNKLEKKGVLVHFGFYDWNIPFRNHIWMGSPYVFKIDQTLVNDYTKGELVYKPLFTHMRTRPYKKDLILNVHPKPEDHQQKGIDAALEIVGV